MSSNERIKARVKVAIRLVDNKTGRIILSDIVEGTRAGSVRRADFVTLLTGASNNATFKIIDKINQMHPLRGTILNVEKDIIYFDLGFSDGVNVGEYYTIYREGDVLAHPVSGEIIGIAEKSIGRVQALEVNQNYSYAEIIGKDGAIKVGDKIKR